MSYESSDLNESINFGKLAESIEDDVFLEELGSVSVEAIGNEYWDVIKPRITWSCAKEYPRVLLCDFDKRFRPGPRPHEPLFVKDEERILDLRVFLDVVPAVDGNSAV